MAPSHIARRPHLPALLCLILLCAYPPDAGAHELSNAAQSPGLVRSAAVADQLVVRARAGLHPRLRRQLLGGQAAQEVGRIHALGAFIVRVPRQRLRAVEKALRRSGYFKSVERDYLAAATQIPNDPEFPNQWGLAKVRAPAAWDVTLGSSSVTVAVVDSGVDGTHPDLHNQLVPGYDFVNNDLDPSDDNGHGTRMAGIVAAETFNATGVAGVAPNCKLMPVKVLGADALGSYSAIASGIVYAADHGARVINLSLGGPAAASALQSAVDYATARGAVVVASAGNSGTGDPFYPAAYPKAVAVSATDPKDSVASFSNYGSWLTLAAPGVNIVTTNWLGSGGLAYAATTGTSPAAAFVSGAFALLFSAHPELSVASALSVMTGTAHDLGSAGWDPYAGWGRVNASAALAFDPAAAPTPIATPAADRTAPTVGIVSPVRNALVFGNAPVDVAASDDVGVTHVQLFADNVAIATDTAPPFSFLWDTTTVTPGKHALRARAYDAAGNVKTSRTVRVQATRGVGLSTQHARLSPSQSANALTGTVSLSAIFVLPDGVALNQGPSALSAGLRSAKGPVFATELQPDALTAEFRKTARFAATATDATGATVKVVISHLQNQPAYNLSLSASGVNLANADSIMSLTVDINGATLSESVSFRPRNSGFMFP